MHRVAEEDAAAAAWPDGGDDRSGAWERTSDPSRVLALSDGVFAIIITPLVLDGRVPELHTGQTLAEVVGELRPSLSL